jgi:hypothetical protein
MKRLEWALRRAGFGVANLDYPSRRFAIEKLAAEYLAPWLKARPAPPGARLHFVTHSLGGILLRCQLREALPQLGRIVMLAPPNHGSEVADRLQSHWFYRALNGPAGQQLGTSGLPGTLGPAPGETGVIAGNVALNPLFASWFHGPNDGKVSVESARLEGMADFLVLPVSHTWLPWSTTALRQVVAFLRHGKFARLTPVRGA